MSQVWTTKKAQDIAVGDIIASQSNTFALEVKEISEKDEGVHATVYANMYRNSTDVYIMNKFQDIPVAVSGVGHMDIITSYELSEGSNIHEERP